jgi:hypothetical protein
VILKKWRSPKTSAIYIFVNKLDPPLDDVTVTDDGRDGWKIGKPHNARVQLTPQDVQDVVDLVEDKTGAKREEGFKALCKEVEW